MSSWSADMWLDLAEAEALAKGQRGGLVHNEPTPRRRCRWHRDVLPCAFCRAARERKARDVT